ncbi:MAG: hypothetical protein GX786_03620 [Clostridiales bacterium]|nr:hypothetical protein [Clostridiales bacterium]
MNHYQHILGWAVEDALSYLALQHIHPVIVKTTPPRSQEHLPGMYRVIAFRVEANVSSSLVVSFFPAGVHS